MKSFDIVADFLVLYLMCGFKQFLKPVTIIPIFHLTFVTLPTFSYRQLLVILR